ncbi:MAG: PH domain-containing protein [Syntrophomonas sp.]|uniref:PH domain-containing protein n=1 Tax=Syntrophomonas sp. TaxID=2053627 RepID=UPI00261145A1|nr:PH domain-containing protein [Syntrophomonas sp.]MDD2509788.1 PH domain-containing protein [Syntrophomonas sp.]MDD3878896.1 PH domain-containing protein [Syntrophomonas sp.]MDD4625719.1 PH domain-containing protein [Syntrophomonas sp.]
MAYKTENALGLFFGLLMGVLIFGFTFWGIDFSLGADDRTLKIMLYIPAYLFLAFYLFLIVGLINMGYRIEESGLTIKWGLYSVTLPWTEIDELFQVQGRGNIFSMLGASWPGYMVGLYSVKGLGLARMFATTPQKGFIYLKTACGFYGITPADKEMIKAIADKANKEVQVVDMDEISEEIKGKNIQDDRFYKILFNLNLFFLLLFAAYLAIFFPGSGAPPSIILLLVLAVALFFFGIGNAGRLYQFSEQGGCILLLLTLAVTGIFFILSLSEITLR